MLLMHSLKDVLRVISVLRCYWTVASQVAICNKPLITTISLASVQPGKPCTLVVKTTKFFLQWCMHGLYTLSCDYVLHKRQ